MQSRLNSRVKHTAQQDRTLFEMVVSALVQIDMHFSRDCRSRIICLIYGTIHCNHVACWYEAHCEEEDGYLFQETTLPCVAIRARRLLGLGKN